ncbi:MAG: amino acid carrier protein [Chlamydiia bacterium]|nr:amino acid carrier protein [Chlamydiia bacterium]
MFDDIFNFLSHIDELFWSYFAFILIIVLGSILTIKNKFFQLLRIPQIGKTFFTMAKHGGEEKGRGVHPLKAFFASVGGMVGIGNVVGVITAINLGGPGALFWLWIAGLIGAIVKYSEIYLGLKYRQPNDHGGYDGGPMFFLKKAFKSPLFPTLVAILLCIYGVEIYQFTVATESVINNWPISRPLFIALILGLVLYGGAGGVKRIGSICSWLMPVFISVYLLMALWVIFSKITFLPSVLFTVFKSAFTGHAAVGGFVGSSMILAIQHGVARAAYSSDIGIGYDSILQSESNTIHPQRQACLAIIGVGIDSLICTVSMLVVLLTDVWTNTANLPASLLIQEALSKFFPYMYIFIPLFLIISMYTTVIAYLVVGLKCAHYLFPNYGRKFYFVYATFSLIFFSFFDPSRALIVMSIAGAMLLIINLLGIFRLRNEITFSAGDMFEYQSLTEEKIA